VLHWIALAGLFIPHWVDILGWGNLDVYVLGIFVTLSALALAGACSVTKMRHRVLSMAISFLAIAWLLEQAVSMVFGVSIYHPWWAIIETTILALIGLNSIIRSGREKSDCVAYYKTPTTFLDVLACLLGGDLKQTCIEIDGRFYGFRNGFCNEINGFDVKRGYEVRFIPRTKAEKIRANKGKPWRPWRNCVWCLL
jgi:uncharacterized membrane protein